jgi:tetratricopeptide (TPR) repeat protein
MAHAVDDVLKQLRTSKGKLIITSCLEHLPSTVRPLPLEKLSEEASIDYLLERTGLDDREHAKEIATLLDGLPVALEQAGAYIIHLKISFEKYLARFEKIEKRLLDFDAKKLGLGDYPSSVLTTWTMTEKQLGPVARAVLALAAFLAPEGISEELFVHQCEIVLEAAGILSDGRDLGINPGSSREEKEDVVEMAIAELASYSMISRNADGDSFSVHRLVQEVTRLRVAEMHKETFTQLILAIIVKECPDYDTAIKTQYAWHRNMDSHLIGLIAYTGQLWPKVNDIPEAIAGNLAGQINNLAQLYKAINRLAEAEPLMNRALAIDEKAFGKDHPNVATGLNNLALLYLAANRLPEAEPLMKRALAVDEKAFGKDHPNVARDLNNLAQLYQATNRQAKAESLMKRVVEICEKVYGKDHPNIATALNNLAQLCLAANRMTETESLMERALGIDEKTLGTDHPDVVRDLNNLAQLYQATNRQAKAEPLIKRVVEICEKVYGKDHPNVAIALNNLALLYMATHRLPKAEPLLKRALDIDKKALGRDHPEVATELNNLAQLYLTSNRLIEAEPLMKRNLIIFIKFTRTTGHQHPHLQTAINNYSGLLEKMGHTKEQAAARIKALAPELFGEG